MYGVQFEMSEEALSPDFLIPFGKAKVEREGWFGIQDFISEFEMSYSGRNFVSSFVIVGRISRVLDITFGQFLSIYL